MTRSVPKLAAAIAVLVFTALALGSSTGFFTIDEFIVFAGADAMARHGSLFVQNGTPDFVSGQLRLWLLVKGENGLVPQYPPGSALIGAPLLSAFGLRGLILSNAFAALASVFVLYRMVVHHFGGRVEGLVACALFVGATFLLEYAVGVWPHAWSVLAVLVSSTLTLDLIHEERPALWRAATIGIALGMGFLFRTDTVLAAAALGAALFFFIDRPVKPLLAMGVGAAPFILLLAALNYAKFGTLNPFTYGQSAGGTAMSSHLALLVVVPGLVAGGFAIKHFWKSEELRRPMLVGGGLLLAAGLAIGHDFAWRWGHGFWALIVDATAVVDTNAGVERHGDGTVSFWNLPKKALGQSLPWLALAIPALFSSNYVSVRTRWTLGVLMLVWTIPFFPRDWHGGMGSNMRYFLPLVPFFCALAAATFVRAWRGSGRPVVWALLGWIAAFSMHGAWKVLHPTGTDGFHQIFPTYLLLAAALCAGYFLWKPGQKGAAQLIIFTGLASATVAAQLAYADFEEAQKLRVIASEFSETHQALPAQSLVFAPARYLVGWAFRPQQIAALPNSQTGKLDTGLIDHALGKGYRVFIWPRYVTEQLTQDPRYILRVSEFGREKRHLVEVSQR